jgi:hypothetical protein
MSFSTGAKRALDCSGVPATSGTQGVRTASKTTMDGKPVASALARSVSGSWKPAVVGAYIGALAASLGRRGKPAYGTVLLSGLLGATIGLTGRATFGPRA